METNKKQYGLILPQKTSQPSATIGKKLSAFADSDSDEESNVDWVKKTLQKETYGNQKCRPSKLAIEKALREDPTVYSYDEVYDEMKKEQNKHVETKKTVDRKPKYMQCLLAQAAKRKQEDERRKERQIQKEREAEGDQFADKESFVTSAYKKKLEEMKQMDAEEQRQNMLENIGDVTKQPDISGFYHHLYKKLDSDDDDDKTTPAETNDFQKLRDKLKRTDESKNTNRQYRARVSESSSSDEESQSKSKVRRRLSPSTSEATKRRKIRESASVDDESESKVTRDETTNDNVTSTESTAEVKTESLEDEKKSGEEQTESGDDMNKESKKPSKSSSDDESNEVQTEQMKEKPKRSIWEKRTVGEVFEQALLRYLERKAGRLVSEVV